MIMSRLITAFIFIVAGSLVWMATKNVLAGSATTVILFSLDCIVQDGVRRFKQ